MYSRQEAAGVGALGAAEGGGAESPPPFPTARLLEMLGEAGVPLPLDAQEAESGNTAMHTAAFGGCVEMAISLVGLGASVGLPNRDGTDGRGRLALHTRSPFVHATRLRAP